MNEVLGRRQSLRRKSPSIIISFKPANYQILLCVRAGTPSVQRRKKYFCRGIPLSTFPVVVLARGAPSILNASHAHVTFFSKKYTIRRAALGKKPIYECDLQECVWT